MTKGLVLGFSCFLLFLSHIFIFHNFTVRRKFLAIAVAFFCGIFIYTFLFLSAGDSRFDNIIPVALLAFLNGVFLHFFCGYFYLHLIEAIDRSVATRIMTEIERSAPGKLSLERIKQVYSIEEKISRELEDMVILGRLVKHGQCYQLTSRGRFHSAVFRAIRNYLRLRRG